MGSSSNTNNHRRIAKTKQALTLLTAFLFGVALCSSFFLYKTTLHINNEKHNAAAVPRGSVESSSPHELLQSRRREYAAVSTTTTSGNNITSTTTRSISSTASMLVGVRILVAIASYDFLQLANLEEVLDALLDFCYAGTTMDIIIYTTVLYPVALLDMLNDRLRCNNDVHENGAAAAAAKLTVTIILKPSHVRLHLVDYHRELFYERIDQYDVFVYTEDDIRITPKTVAAYLHETNRINSLVGPKRATDYNVGIVRYEYNYPENVIITDKTRHASVNVTRVYWEHVGRPIFDKLVNKLDSTIDAPELSLYYITMAHPHQGMYMVTPTLLLAWKDRPKCNFNIIRNRPSHPSNPSQPTEGTQRVWMSSQMMYGTRHCAIKQLLPVDNFGQLTVHHLPNKNYRRVGKQGRLGGHANAPVNEFSDGTEVFAPSHPDLLKALELHIELKRQFRHLQSSNIIDNSSDGEEGRYNGIRIVDTDINNHNIMASTLEAYKSYVKRGGYMIDTDMDIDIDAWRTSSSL